MPPVTVFRNCKLLKDHQIIDEDLWVQGGKIIDPATLFFERGRNFDREWDCGGALLAPGLIDLQINGGFKVDFTYDIKDEASAKECLGIVGRGILAHGVTSYCPTLVTSLSETYHTILPHLGPKPGSKEDGANVLGAHLEGPFISRQKKGAHKPEFIRTFSCFKDLCDMYGPTLFNNAKIVTLAPEQDPDGEVVSACADRGICVSVGHSAATLKEGENAVRHGATLITHLFNAMTSFHHRDPGLLGLLTSRKLGAGHRVFYGLIADGTHTHPAAVRIAYRTNFPSLCLVTDAITGLGLDDGRYNLGEQPIEVRDEKAFVAGTETLCGAVVSLFGAVKKAMRFSQCSLVEGLEAASLHPAQALGMEGRKGSLNFGADADFIMIDVDKMDIKSTWIAGNRVYQA